MACLYNVYSFITDSTDGSTTSTAEINSDKPASVSTHQFTTQPHEWDTTAISRIMKTTKTMIITTDRAPKESTMTDVMDTKVTTPNPNPIMTTLKNISASPDTFKILFSIFVPLLVCILICLIMLVCAMYFKSRDIKLARDELITLQLATFESEL